MPLLDGGLELHAGVAADVRAFGDFAQEVAGLFFLAGLAVGHPDRGPFASLEGGVHEFIGHADGEVLVLIHDRAVGFAVERAVIALLDEGPGFALLAHFGLDEFFDVGMPILERVHLGRAAGFTAAFDHAGHLVVNFEEGKRTARFAAAAQFFTGRAQGGEVAARAAAVFEKHGFALGQIEDAFHVVLDGLDEAGAGLRVFVLGGSALGFARQAIVEIIALTGVLADAVLLGEADVEPHGAVEGTVLVEAEPGQVIVKGLGAGLVGKVTVGLAEVGDGAGDAVDELADGGFASAFVWVGAIGDVAVEIFRDGDLGGERTPAAGDFHVFLFEDDLARIVIDLGRALVPFHVVEGRAGLGVETLFEFEALRLGVGDAGTAGGGFGAAGRCRARGGRFAGLGTEG